MNYENDLIVGADAKKIDQTISNIYACADRINSIFNQYDELIEKTKRCYVCNNADDIRERYAYIRNNFKTINDNILKYVDKLMDVKSGFRVSTSNLTDLVNYQRMKEGNE